MSSTVIDELVTILGIELDEDALKKLDKFNAGMNKAVKVAEKMVITVTAAATSMGYWLKTIGKNSEDLVRLSQMTGVSTDSIQALGYAVEQLGGDSQALKNDILGLQKTMTSPIPGQFNAELLMLGVATRDAAGNVRGVEDVLDDLSARFANMNAQQALQWGSRLGLSQDTIRLLQQGQVGIRQLKVQAESLGGIIPNEALRSSIKFNQGLKDIWLSIKSITTQIGLAFLPSLTRVIDKFREWIRANQEWLKLRLRETVDGISDGFERFWNVIIKVKNAIVLYGSKLLDSLGITMDLKTATEIFIGGALIGLVALLVVWAAINWETLAIVAGVIALGVAVEDVIRWFTGAPSLIGDFFDAFEKRFPALYAFMSWLAHIVGTVIVGSFRILWSLVKATFTAISDGVNLMMKAVNWLLEKLGWDKNNKELQDTLKMIDKGIETGDNAASGALDSASAGGHKYNQSLINGNSGNGPVIHDNKKIEINVQGSANPQQTASQVVAQLQPYMLNTPGSFGPVVG